MILPFTHKLGERIYFCQLIGCVRKSLKEHVNREIGIKIMKFYDCIALNFETKKLSVLANCTLS
jgi:hypothetical protein